MSGMEIWVYVVLVLIAVAAPRYGVDSRWGPPTGRRRTVRGDLARLAQAVGDAWGQASSRSERPADSRCPR